MLEAEVEDLKIRKAFLSRERVHEGVRAAHDRAGAGVARHPRADQEPVSLTANQIQY